VDFGRRADCGTGARNGVLLPDRDSGADSGDVVDVGAFELLDELPGVCRKGFDVAALTFREDRIERER